MGVINKAIEKGWHEAKAFKKSNASWEEFERVLLEKKLVLYGVGNGAEYYYFRYREKACADIVVDASSDKIGKKLGDVLLEVIDEGQKDIIISDPAVLETYDKKEMVILICSLKAYEEIAIRLEAEGYENIFALLPMEAKKRDVIQDVEYMDIGERCRKEMSRRDIDKKKIVILSMFNFGGHGKEIVKQLLRLREDLDIVWIVDDLTVEVEQGVRLILNKNIRDCLTEMQTAKIWICDTGIPEIYRKREGQVYIQIKHWASVTLKNFGFDLARMRNDKLLLKICEHDSQMIDYIMVGSEFDERTCRSGFEFDGRFLYTGSPRSDVLFDSEDICLKIKKKYGLTEKIKLLLYSPTFRCEKGDAYIPNQIRMDLDFEKVKHELEQSFGGEWLILLRLHPVVAHKADEMELPPYVINVSNYNDSQELVAASDAMITDYSSIMFEPAFVKKPVFLFATDRAEYIDGERGLLIDYDELPFPISETNEELAEQISEFNQESYERTLDMFFESYGVHEDGHASERAAQFISDIIDGKEI